MDFTIYKEMDNWRFTGRLQGSADGTATPGKCLANYPVYIVDRKKGKEYPILLGDKNSKQLGWCRESNLNGAEEPTCIII